MLQQGNWNKSANVNLADHQDRGLSFVSVICLPQLRKIRRSGRVEAPFPESWHCLVVISEPVRRSKLFQEHHFSSTVFRRQSIYSLLA